MSDDSWSSERKDSDDRESGSGDAVVGCGVSAGEIDQVERSFGGAVELVAPRVLRILNSVPKVPSKSIPQRLKPAIKTYTAPTESRALPGAGG